MALFSQSRWFHPNTPIGKVERQTLPYIYSLLKRVETQLGAKGYTLCLYKH